MAGITAWGKPTITTAPTDANNGIMVASLISVGEIKEDSATLEVEKGSVLELWGEGHELLDKMEQEGSYKLKFTVVKADIQDIAIMFGLALKDGKLPMTTMIVSEHRSFVVTPLLVGAIGVEIPKTSTSITPKHSAKEGWSFDFEITSLQPTAEYAPATFFKKA